MHIPLSEAKAQLEDLVRRAAAGEEIVLTEGGTPLAEIVSRVSVTPVLTAEERLRRMDEISRRASEKALPGPSAARSQDFLYDGNGLPG